MSKGKKMNYAREMYNNSYGKGWFRSWSMAHFAVVEEVANGLNESVKFTFMGLMRGGRGEESFLTGGNWAFGITDDKMIYAQEKIIGNEFRTIFLNQIRDITYRGGIYFGIIIIDALTEKIEIALEKRNAKEVAGKLIKILKCLNKGERKC